MFTDLDEKLRLLLETVVPTNVVSLPLKQVNNTIYATAVDQDKYLNNTRMYLAVSADAGEDTIIRRVPQLVKVCSATHIDQLDQLRLCPALPSRTFPARRAPFPSR